MLKKITIVNVHIVFASQHFMLFRLQLISKCGNTIFWFSIPSLSSLWDSNTATQQHLIEHELFLPTSVVVCSNLIIGAGERCSKLLEGVLAVGSSVQTGGGLPQPSVGHGQHRLLVDPLVLWDS